MEKMEKREEIKNRDNKSQEMNNKKNNNIQKKYNQNYKENVPNRISKKTTENSNTIKNKNMNENRDTTGDTKVFQIIRKEDIEKEKKLQAIKKENNGNVVKQKLQNNNALEKLQQNQKSEINIQKYNNYQQKNKNQILNSYQNQNINQEENKKQNKSRKKLLIILLIIILIILFITIISTVFGLININSNKIINGTKINGIEVSNLSKEEANQKLENILNNNENNIITVTYSDYSKEIHLQDIDGKFNTTKAVETAYTLGRESDVVHNNYKTIQNMFKGENLEIEFSYNEELLKNKIDEISLEIPGVATESSYIIDGNRLVIKNSKAGIQVVTNGFKQSILNAFIGTEKSFVIPVEHAKRKEINIESIHEEIYKKPVNAYYTTNPRKVYKEENGLDFGITVEEAKKLLQEDKDEYEIPLKTLKPDVTVAKLDSGAFPNQLSTFTTTYGTGDTNRNTNIAIAARSINSVVVMPGETFSYNDLIGECSTRTGYKESTIYLNGKLSTGIGGGICQVSTTLYNTVLRANLEIVERRNHSLGVTYVPAGHDAMVSIGSSDFKFKNNRDYPIKVVAYTGPGSITCQIYGLKQDTEYEVKLESKTIEKTDKKYKVQTYKVLYLNGKVVSRTWLSTDTYKYH